MRRLVVAFAIVAACFSVPANAKIPENQALSDFWSYAIQTKFNHDNAGFSRFFETHCVWTGYKHSGQNILVCHTSEKFLKSGRVVTGYFFILANGKIISTAQARKDVERS